MSSSGQQKQVILLVNRDKEPAVRTGRELRDWLADRVEVTADNIETDLAPAAFPDADFIIILGGDGTILSTVRQLGDRQIPVIGVNMGKLGFLAEFNVDQLKTHFDRLITDDSLIIRRIMLDCCITGPQRKEYYTRAVNEIAVIAGPPFRMIEVSVSIGDDHLALCSGDGLIVATPTGSTAYNLSAGGPILTASLEGAVITPLAAHSLGFRPIVVNLDKPIRIRPQPGSIQPKGTTQTTVMVAIDGQDHQPLYDDDIITLQRANACFQLVHSPDQSQWRLLNAKLNWGILPNYKHRLYE